MSTTKNEAKITISFDCNCSERYFDCSKSYGGVLWSCFKIQKLSYGVFSHDVTAAILVSHNNETAAMLVFQTNPLGVALFSYANAFFRSNKFAQKLAT